MVKVFFFFLGGVGWRGSVCVYVKVFGDVCGGERRKEKYKKLWLNFEPHGNFCCIWVRV